MDLQISLGAGLLPLFKIGLTVCIRQEPNALSLPWWVVSERFHAKGFPVCPGGMTRGRKRQSSLLFLKKTKNALNIDHVYYITAYNWWGQCLAASEMARVLFSRILSSEFYVFRVLYYSV